MKDVIRRRGVNISSFEVEAEVLSHPAREGRRPRSPSGIPTSRSRPATRRSRSSSCSRTARRSTRPSSSSISTPRMPRHWVPRFVEFVAGASAHGVVQGEQGRPPRGRRHGRHLGPREGRRQAQAGGALTLRGRSGAARRDDGRAAARGREVHDLRRRRASRCARRCPACGGAVERILLPRSGDALDLDDPGLRAEGRRTSAGRASSCPTPSATSSSPARCASKGC